MSPTPSAHLTDIEAALGEHFQRLKATKRANGDATPLFAIEHGLDQGTVSSIGERLGSSLGHLGHMSPKHQLTWVVHAAERGYNFGGLEYWDSFAQSTPNWGQRGDRATLRAYFENFSKRYGGIEPSGGWARHYKYICWPIAHALLPRDLQVQLAHAIFRARYQLGVALAQTDEVLGRLVAYHAYYPTHRFALFLRDGRLVGWIVRMLLRGENESSGIEPKALTRIVEDLRSESHARTWLTESRGVYQQHSVRTNGGHLGMLSSPWFRRVEVPSWDSSSNSGKEPELEPRLTLIQTMTDVWKPIIAIPSFRHLAATHEQLLDHLTVNRVGVLCHGTQMGPASALLSPAGLERSIAFWPGERAPVLKFDRQLPLLDDVVHASCQLRPCGMWLFRVCRDGTARQIHGTMVRPGKKYVVVARDAAKLPSFGRSQQIQCEGVSAVAIEIPDPVSPALAIRLQQSGLSAAYSVTLAPVGAVPVGWSPQSLGEWLSKQTVCFKLKRDHQFAFYSIQIQGQAATCIPVGSESDQLILLDGLREGRHNITISTHAAPAQDGVAAKVLRAVTLPITIRPPRTWAPRQQPPQAMLVTCTPATPTFSEFVSGQTRIRIDGDLSRTVSVRLDLLNGSGKVIGVLPICKQRLPVTSGDLREAIGRALTADVEQLDFLSFDAAQIVIDGGDLGLRKIVLQEAVQPLRWRYVQGRSKAELKLIDDLEKSIVRVRFASFAQPHQWMTVPVHKAASGINIGANDGLYVASNADQESCVVVSGAVGKGFDLFRVNIKPVDLPRSIQDTLEVYRVWSMARACGLASRHRQRKVLQILQEHGFGLLVGRRWRELEKSLAAAPSEEDWERLEASAHWGTTYGILLSRAWMDSHSDNVSLEERFVRITTRLQLAEDSEVARCAWRLAGGIQGIGAEEAIDICRKYAGKLASSMRGARLLCLFTEKNRSVAVMEEVCKS